MPYKYEKIIFLITFLYFISGTVATVPEAEPQFDPAEDLIKAYNCSYKIMCELNETKELKKMAFMYHPLEQQLAIDVVTNSNIFPLEKMKQVTLETIKDDKLWNGPLRLDLCNFEFKEEHAEPGGKAALAWHEHMEKLYDLVDIHFKKYHGDFENDYPNPKTIASFVYWHYHGVVNGYGTILVIKCNSDHDQLLFL